MSGHPLPFLKRSLQSEYFALFLCVAAIVGFAPITPGFASIANFQNILIGALPLLVLASGQTLVLVTGGIDLSVTGIIGLSSVTGAIIMSGDHGCLAGSSFATPAALATMLVTGMIVGALNGCCVAWLRMPPFMVTLTTTMFFSGLAVWIAQRVAKSDSISQLPKLFVQLGAQPFTAIAISLLAVLTAHVLLNRTLLGHWLYFVGHNTKTSEVSGIPVPRVVLTVYLLSGGFAAITSFLLTATLETGSPLHGRQLLLDVIGAAVIGGTSLSGGRGKILWTVFGVIFLSLLSNGLNLLNHSDFVITIIKGSVILVAAVLDRWRHHLAQLAR